MAGRKLLRAKGFDALTTQEVALEAGIPPGTLFGYISNKTDLLIIALVHEAMEFVATIPSRIPAAGSCKDRVMFVFEEMAVYHGRDVEITRHFLRELAITLNKELTERSHALRYWVTGVYSRAEYSTTLRKALKWQFMGIAATPATGAGSGKARAG